MLTVQDMAERLGVPERTIRRWIDLHGAFLGARKDGRRLLVPADSLKVAERIKQLYEDGATAAQVTDSLRGADVPAVIDVMPVTPMQAESLVRELLDHMRTQSDELTELRREMKEIRELLLTQAATAAMAEKAMPAAGPKKGPGLLVRAWRAFWSD